MFYFLISCRIYHYLITVSLNSFILNFYQFICFYIFSIILTFNLIKCSQKILHRPNLAGLADTVIVIVESSFIIKFQCCVDIFKESQIHKQADYGCASSTFSMIAMKTYNSIFLFQKLKRIVTDLKQSMQRWCLMVFPDILFYSLFEQLVFIFSIAHVNYQISRRVIFFEKFCHICYRIPVSLLYACSRKSHCYNCISYVCEIQVKILSHRSIFRPCHHFSQLRNHNNFLISNQYIIRVKFYYFNICLQPNSVLLFIYLTN